MRIDPRTGLAELPDGYFFCVRREWQIDGNYLVQIRRGWGLFSYKVEQTNLRKSLTEARMIAGATQAYERFALKEKSRNEAKRLMGNYPPKTLAKKS